MRFIKRTSLPLALILLGVLACALPVVPVIDQNAGATAVAQTVDFIMQMTQAAAINYPDLTGATPTLPPDAFPTLTATWTPESPTLTATWTPEPPTLTATWTPEPPTPAPTVTSLVPLLSVSVPTNCRNGPGKMYDTIGAVLVGDVVQVYARDPSSNYWYVRNPAEAGHPCWVWGEYATLTGFTAALPVYTPPPSPTPTSTSTPSPAFQASYAGIDSCSGAWWTDIRLDDTGSASFESISMTVRDTVTSTVVTAISDGLTDNTGCDSFVRKILLPTKHAVASSPQFSYDLTGHKLKATVTLCSDPGLNGTCLTQSIVFTP